MNRVRQLAPSVAGRTTREHACAGDRKHVPRTVRHQPTPLRPAIGSARAPPCRGHPDGL